MKSLHQLILSSVLLTPLLVFAEAEIPDVITVKKMSMELAAEIATKAVKTCRDQGYQVSAVVVDRSGNMQVAMRDVHASRFTLQIAEEKANAVILGGVSSGEIRKNRADIRQELNHVDGL
ncbi:MAG: heme-binding protein, partial [Gammaproteobacteria bacterium]